MTFWLYNHQGSRISFEGTRKQAIKALDAFLDETFKDTGTRTIGHIKKRDFITEERAKSLSRV